MKLIFLFDLKSVKKALHITLLILLAATNFRCETKERFFRPDLPQKLCTIGIFDIDDTTYYDTFSPLRPGFIPRESMIFSRSISFEISFQSEFSKEINDSLSELSFTISDTDKDMFVFNSNDRTGNLESKVPVSLQFETGRKYFLNASEKKTADISAEITVPEFPPQLSLLSIKTGTNILDMPKDNCHYHTGLGYTNGISQYTRRTAEIEFSFPSSKTDSYYAILLTGSYSDSRVDWSPGWGSNLLNFDVLEGNTNGFFYPVHGRKTVQTVCESHSPVLKLFPVNAFFIDGNKIPDGICSLKILTYWDNERFDPAFIKCFRVRLMSIPKELYLFEKSLYTYSKVSDDPFSEPSNIMGNIKGGNGVFAICRSRELIVYTGQKGTSYDTFF